MRIFEDDAKPWQKVIGLALIVIFFPLGLIEVSNMFGGPSNALIVAVSLVIAMTYLGVSLETLNPFSGFIVVVFAVVLHFAFIEFGWVSPTDHPFRIIGFFILLHVVNATTGFQLKRGG